MKRKNQKFETDMHIYRYMIHNIYNIYIYIYIYIYTYTHTYIHTQIESVYIIHTKYRFGWDYICIFN